MSSANDLINTAFATTIYGLSVLPRRAADIHAYWRDLCRKPGDARSLEWARWDLSASREAIVRMLEAHDAALAAIDAEQTPKPLSVPVSVGSFGDGNSVIGGAKIVRAA